MKNNQVYLDPSDIERSMQQLARFYRLDAATLAMLRRVVTQYPRPVIMYVDEANAPLYAQSPLDDHFTFNMQTGELVLFSSDPMTFIDALIEMWMYISGFETLMGDDSYWKVEFAIGSWKPVKNNIKDRLGIPVSSQIMGIVGLPPDPEEAPIEDPYPFKTLVSDFNLMSFTQMVRLAGRPDVRVNFPNGTDDRVKEVYFTIKKAMLVVGEGLDIFDATEFNRRLMVEIEELEKRYQPDKLPLPKGWQWAGDDQEAASGEVGGSDKKDEEDPKNEVGLMLGPPKDEPDYGKLPSGKKQKNNADEVDDQLARGPFGEFIDQLFEDE